MTCIAFGVLGGWLKDHGKGEPTTLEASAVSTAGGIEALVHQRALHLAGTSPRVHHPASRSLLVDPRRAAWRQQHAHEEAPWRGPVHAAPLLAGLAGRVVELGAGGGKVGGALPDSIALDWAPEGLRDARSRVAADVRALPFRAGSVDALVAIHVLGHLWEKERASALAEWRRVLRPGGALVLEVFAAGDAREGDGEETEPATWTRGGIPTHYFGDAELRGLLSGWSGDIIAEERALRWGTRRVLRGRLTR